jgi:hypothetical protein
MIMLARCMRLITKLRDALAQVAAGGGQQPPSALTATADTSSL